MYTRELAWLIQCNIAACVVIDDYRLNITVEKENILTNKVINDHQCFLYDYRLGWMLCTAY